MSHMNFLRKRHRRLYGLLLLLLQLSFAQEVSFRITPLRPVEELRAEALKEQPPHEQGTFLKPDLVELVKLDPTIKLDIRYATTNNFLGTPVYTQARAFLQRPAAAALLRAHRELQAQGYGLIIHDGYRPWYVTKIFWDATPADKKIFVADPAAGSKHNRGCAVDLSLIRFENGEGGEDAQWLRRNERSRLCRLRRRHARGARSTCSPAPSHGKTGLHGLPTGVVALRL
jgi:D-alanyl-D-alanine dipeptidase